MILRNTPDEKEKTMFLSPPQQSHGQTIAVRLALTLLLLLAIVPLTIASFGEKGRIEYVPLSIAAALLAVCVVLWIVIGKTVLSLHPEGICRTTAFSAMEIAWEDVAETRYRVIPIQVGGLFGMAAQAAAQRVGGRAATTSMRLAVVARDGRRIVVTSNYRQAPEAIGLILGKVQPPILAEARRRVEAGDFAVFGPLSVSRAGISWKKKEPVPFSDVSAGHIAGQYLRLRRRGKLFDIVKVRSDKIPNVLVFLDLIESLGAGAGEIKGIDPLARVRV